MQWEWVPLDKIAEKPLILNLRENLENIIEIPTVLMPELNPIPAFYYGNNSLIKSDEELSLQKAVDTICKAHSQGLIDRFEFEEKTNKYLDSFEKSLFVNRAGDVRYYMRLREDAFEKGFKYLRKEFRNGKWKYFYQETRGDKDKKEISKKERKELEEKFGTILEGYANKPKEAFKKVLEEGLAGRPSQVLGAFNLEIPVFQRGKIVEGETVNTPIDFVWEDKSVGVKHIMKHVGNIVSEVTGKKTDYASIDELVSSMFNMFTDYKEVKAIDNDLTFYGKEKLDGYKVTIRKRVEGFDKDNNPLEKHYLVTSYDVSVGEFNKIKKTDLVTKIEDLPVISNATFEDSTNVLFPYDKKTALQRYFQSTGADFENKGKIKSVPLNELNATQPFVRKGQLKRIVESGKTEFFRDDKPDQIKVAKINGKMYINDGNHRATIAKLSGQTHIDVLFVDMGMLEEDDNIIKAEKESEDPFSYPVLSKSSPSESLSSDSTSRLVDERHCSSNKLDSDFERIDLISDPKDITFIFNNQILKGKSLELFENESENFTDEEDFPEENTAFEKGKRANIGEIRVWKNKRYQKTSEGWREIREQHTKG